MNMRIWEDMITDRDRIVIEQGGYGRRTGYGEKPLLLCIDLQPNYIGADAPIEEQIEQWPSGGGAKAWEGVRHILSLRDAAREAGVPVFYTKNVQSRTDAFDNFAGKRKRDNAKFIDGHPCSDLLPCIEPLPEEMVLSKGYASAFYGTPLQSYLITLGIDTLILVGAPPADAAVPLRLTPPQGATGLFMWRTASLTASKYPIRRRCLISG
ncbi:cysteine hydrolase [Oscillibacter sp. MSJ-2]|uniref:Cysteine hydrolase n=1 Tax=Dysosmobacter acutus TaxID=2841504 RepID=A0ABS6FFG0_9FIRM|nr:isochorismatase family cysteine hydrolase [Dysosmobacter acutus]MBU5628105.1 cysteine hydrolase [Dysosmobacter acutus]